MSDLKVTPELKEAFLEMLTEIPNLTAVSKLFGVNPTTIHRHRKKDPEWAAAINEAMECGYDMLEAEAIRRAKKGVPEPVYYKGEKIGEVQKYSDTLMGHLLKAYRPKKFNPGQKVEVESENDKVTLVFTIGGKKNEDR